MRIDKRLKVNAAVHAGVALFWSVVGAYMLTLNTPLGYVVAAFALLCVVGGLHDLWKTWKALKSPFLYLAMIQEMCEEAGQQAHKQ